MGSISLPLTHLQCSVAQLSKHFHTAPSASSHRGARANLARLSWYTQIPLTACYILLLSESPLPLRIGIPC